MSDRKNITPNFEARLQMEVANHCPLCGKSLFGEKNGKSVKLYQIAHIYPHSPTPEQLVILKDVPKPDDVEAFENLILLCSDCHKIQDYYTTTDDYMSLYNIKQKLLKQTKAYDNASIVPLETQITEILRELETADINELQKLSYYPVAIEQKIIPENRLLLRKIKEYVVQYFPFVQDTFGRLDEIGKLKFNKLAKEITLCFQNIEEQGLPQEDIFDSIVIWIYNKTQKQHERIACEIIVAFFVQNCEVFNAITE
jgi:5-methylcytosine-specific restriction endonuclease McrA